MPLFIGDYLADTAHLDAEASGAYIHLIMHYWQNGGLPDDDPSLSRIAKLTPKKWFKRKPLLQKYFHHGWRHKRIDFELQRREDISRKRVVAGAMGNKTRSQLRRPRVANAPIRDKNTTSTERIPREARKRSAEELGLTPSAELTETLVQAMKLKDGPK